MDPPRSYVAASYEPECCLGGEKGSPRHQSFTFRTGVGPMGEITVVGIDLAKNVFSMCGRDASGQVVLKKQVRRGQLIQFMAQRRSCRVGMEACGGAHHW